MLVVSEWDGCSDGRNGSGVDDGCYSIGNVGGYKHDNGRDNGHMMVAMVMVETMMVVVMMIK